MSYLAQERATQQVHHVFLEMNSAYQERRLPTYMKQWRRIFSFLRPDQFNLDEQVIQTLSTTLDQKAQLGEGSLTWEDARPFLEIIRLLYLAIYTAESD